MKFFDNRKYKKVLMYLFKRLLDTHMLKGGHLKLLCIQFLEFFYFHSSPEAKLLCDWQMCRTYSCPCEYINVHRSRPTFLTDWPCDLFMVIANASRTGNCLLQSGIGRVLLEGVNVIWGISTLFSENHWFPEITV